MELAIPFIALCGMYIISNKKNKEGFTTENLNVSQYPSINTGESLQKSNSYTTSNQSALTYLNQNEYKNRVESRLPVTNNIQNYYSMVDDTPVNYSQNIDYAHQNSANFNGKKIGGQIYNMNVSESILDNMAGTGSQIIKKEIQAPLFQPASNMTHVNGTPNMTDFERSRQYPSKYNNVNPFQPMNVGPGINQGYSNVGTGGYNSGMEARDKWLDKTVDELRTTTNPKQEYILDGLQGSAGFHIKSTADVNTLGLVEKKKPDGFFENSPERWITTTGQEKGVRLIPSEVPHPSSRNSTTHEYIGTTGGVFSAGYAPTQFIAPNRTETTDISNLPGPPTTKGLKAPETNMFQKSFTNNVTNRSSNQQASNYNIAHYMVNAFVSPILDIMRPTKKEELVESVNLYNIKPSVTGAYVTNQGDTAKPTINETTLFSYVGNINNQDNGCGAYATTPYQAVGNDRNQRNTTTEFSGYIGGVGGQHTSSDYGQTNFTAEYNQRNNDIKSSTVTGRINQGGMGLINSNINMPSVHKPQYSNQYNYYSGPAILADKQTPGIQAHGNYTKLPQQYNSEIQMDRNHPDILNAFKENPYTFPLNSYN